MHAAKIPCRPFRLLLRRLAFRAGVRIVEVRASDLFSLGPRCAQLCSQQQWMVVQQSGGKTRARARLVSGSLQLETCLLPATQTFCFFFFLLFYGGRCFLRCTCALSSCTFANWIKNAGEEDAARIGRSGKPASARGCGLESGEGCGLSVT